MQSQLDKIHLSGYSQKFVQESQFYVRVKALKTLLFALKKIQTYLTF